MSQSEPYQNNSNNKDETEEVIPYQSIKEQFDDEIKEEINQNDNKEKFVPKKRDDNDNIDNVDNDNNKVQEIVKEEEEEVGEEVEEVIENHFFASADNVVDEINKIQYSINRDKDKKQQQKSMRQELLEKENEEEKQKERNSNTNINTNTNRNINNFSERNRVVNDYIRVLDNKEKKSEPREEEEGDDEFAKAEVTYNQSNKNDLSSLSVSNLNQFQLKSKLFNTPKELNTKNESNSNFSLTLKHPETVYILENKYQRRIQTLRKISKANENMASFKNLNEEKDRSLSSSSRSPLALKRAQDFKLFQKERLALQCLNDSKNPYSKLWIDKILMLRYKSKIEVKGFINAIPQLRLQKIKDVPFPNISSSTHHSSSVGSRNGKVDCHEENKAGEQNKTKRIEYPFILRYFQEKQIAGYGKKE